MKARVLVYCANGLQGQAMIPQLLTSGVTVKAMVRDADRALRLSRQGAELVHADFADRQGFRRAHAGIDVVLMQVPAGLDAETTRRFGFEALEVIAEAGIKRVIFNVAVQYPRHVEELPTFEALRQVEDQVRGSPLQHALVHNTFLLTNLLLPWVTASIAKDGAIVYPVSHDRKLSWAAPEDVGRLAAEIIARDAFGTDTFVAGTKALDGNELAECFSQALGRSIRFVSLPIDRFEQGVDAAIGPGAGARVGAIFRFIERHADDLGFVSSVFEPPAHLPSFQPTTPSDWVRLHRDAFVAGHR
jgi:uncharacterized protein YbjT (DUF2867 family)